MPDRPRILWLHTQPEHYFNCMMDDLEAAGNFEYVAAFSSKGTGSYTEVPMPRVAKTLFLGTRAGVNWRAELDPLKFNAAIVSGYGVRVHREVIQDCRRRGIPVAMFADSNLRSQRGDTLKWRLKRCVKRRFLSPIIADVDLILTANRLGVAYWRYYGAPSSKMVLCPYYADYARVTAARVSDRAAVLEKNKLPNDAKYLFSAARLVPAKGLGLMIRAFTEARLAERGWHYVIAGVGPLEAELKAQSGALLEKSIHFVGFQQPTDNLALMAHAALFVLPSVYEPHGIVIQEALAAGTPVLASDVCGAAYDLVKPEISGKLFRSGDSQNLRTKLERLLADEGHLVALRQGARLEFERWFARYSPINVVDSVVHRLLDLRRHS